MDRQIISRATELAGHGGKPVAAADGRPSTSTGPLPEQPTLLDLPAVIAIQRTLVVAGISTPLGHLFIPADMATAGQVEQWAREGTQHHGSQHKRFKAIASQLKDLGLDPSENYLQQVSSLGGGQS